MWKCLTTGGISTINLIGIESSNSRTQEENWDPTIQQLMKIGCIMMYLGWKLDRRPSTKIRIAIIGYACLHMFTL
jgi:hypothetical protein